MDVQPAHVDQVLRAKDGQYVTIDSDAGGVADELRRIDPKLKVRFAESGPHWAVYYQQDDRTTYLVLTAEATQGRTGAWGGLDHRIVKRIMKIGHSSYDYAREVERQNVKARKANRDATREKMAEAGVLAYHAIRKDLGVKDRAFIKK